MKPAPVPSRPDDSKREPHEISDFKSILGALLWITATRLDVIADVSVLQSRVTTHGERDQACQRGAGQGQETQGSYAPLQAVRVQQASPGLCS